MIIYYYNVCAYVILIKKIQTNQTKKKMENHSSHIEYWILLQDITIMKMRFIKSEITSCSNQTLVTD